MIDPMRKTLLPTMSALTAFESAARHSSFTRAAAELNLTQGAISRQIRQLEDQLGAQLFRRISQRVVLTEAGRGYLLEVRRTLDHLEVATQRAMAYADGASVLKLAVPPTFSATWLARRLPRFIARNPGVTINCAMRLPWFDQGTEKFDVGIHAAAPTLPNTVVHHLMRTKVVPVCSPGVRAALRLRGPADLQRAALLHQTNRPLAWADWFDAAGVAAPQAFRGPRFEHIAMLIRAAVAGLGVALVPQCLIEDETESGALKVLAPRSPCAELSFHLAVPEAKQSVPGILAFTEWITQEARESGIAAPAARSVPA
jgi:LysR family glycine cleavage system transcriptional activator